MRRYQNRACKASLPRTLPAVPTSGQILHCTVFAITLFCLLICQSLFEGGKWFCYNILYFIRTIRAANFLLQSHRFILDMRIHWKNKLVKLAPKVKQARGVYFVSSQIEPNLIDYNETKFPGSYLAKLKLFSIQDDVIFSVAFAYVSVACNLNYLDHFFAGCCKRHSDSCS